MGQSQSAKLSDQQNGPEPSCDSLHSSQSSSTAPSCRRSSKHNVATFSNRQVDRDHADIDSQAGKAAVAPPSQQTGNHAASVLIDRRDTSCDTSNPKLGILSSQAFPFSMDGWQTEWQDLCHMRSVEIAQEAVFGFGDGFRASRFSFGKDDDAKEGGEWDSCRGIRSTSESESSVPPPPRPETKDLDSGERAKRPRTQSLIARLRANRHATTQLPADSVSQPIVQAPAKPLPSMRPRNRIRIKSFSHRQEHSDLFKWSRRSSAPLVFGLGLQRPQNQDGQVEQRGGLPTRTVAGGLLNEPPVKVLGMPTDPSRSTVRRPSDAFGSGNLAQTIFPSLPSSVPTAPLPPPRQPRRPSDKIDSASNHVASGQQDLTLAVSLDGDSKGSVAIHSQHRLIAGSQRQLPGITSATFPLSPMSEEGNASLLSRSTEVNCDQHLSPLMSTGMVTAGSPPSRWMLSRYNKAALGDEYYQSKRSPLHPSIEQLLPPHDVEEAPYAETGVQASLATLRALESPGKHPKTILARQRILGDSTVSPSGTLRELQNLSSGPYLEADGFEADGGALEAVQLQTASYDVHLEKLALARKEMLLFDSSLNHGRDLSGATFVYIADTSKQEKEIGGVKESTRGASTSSTSSKQKTGQTKQGYGISDIFTWQAGLHSDMHGAGVDFPPSAAFAL